MDCLSICCQFVVDVLRIVCYINFESFNRLTNRCHMLSIVCELVFNWVFIVCWLVGKCLTLICQLIVHYFIIVLCFWWAIVKRLLMEWGSFDEHLATDWQHIDTQGTINWQSPDTERQRIGNGSITMQWLIQQLQLANVRQSMINRLTDIRASTDNHLPNARQWIEHKFADVESISSQTLHFH